jgi:PAS domain S-box-containing protein
VAAVTLRSIPDEVWVVDAAGRVTFVSDAVTNNLGVAPGHWQDIYAAIAELEITYPDGSARPPEQAPLARSLRGEQVTREHELVRNISTGEIRYRAVSGAPVRDGAGAITGAVLVVRDITDQKERERELARSQERLSIAQ